ncbi:retron Ec67 family RNA-directed DNA polymerase/endonuclease [Pseudobdellovibrio exovorus]|uniref:RNA-directed DNA polymerase n=1 Tax=Pseudobdellovibrio exovorus JSS TaxID=1184267 RepID=M4V8T8_9BACT|nr:retron Ec67 family RNA-directed DNA polymerase/endonuclease [Pseudobdellovibrio exovorus]AGH95822.1 hypothetical protein A11Q_1606 [Pseudobdellovibrio exovorus JSS]
MMVNYLKELQQAKSLQDLAKLLGTNESNLNILLYKISRKSLYRTFEIPKKGGGFRIISSPDESLKVVQKRLASILSSILEPNYQLKHKKKLQNPKKERATRAYSNKSVSHAFKQNLSIATNAEQHLKKKYVLNLDLEDFFGSINFGRVRGFFIKDKQFKLDPVVATHIANIICHMDKLPQGSPCSPVMSNLIGRLLDRHLLRLANRRGCFYTRYADDLTFSFNGPKFPTEIAILEQDQWVIGDALTEVIEKSGFKIKKSKVRMHYRTSRQMVTGLVVNCHVNVPAEYYRDTRSMCLNIFTTGSCYLKTNRNKNLSMQQLEGRLNYIYQIKKFKNIYADQGGYRHSRHNGKYKSDSNLDRSTQYADNSHQVSLDGIKNIYGRFLFYKNFFAPQMPLIYCEGKTDPVYLKCALLALETKYSGMVSSGKLNVRFFAGNNLDGEMMKLVDGTGGMKYLISSYNRMKKECKFNGVPLHPVIIVVDNDSAGLEVKKAAKKKRSMTNGVFHIFHNLYILEIPKNPTDAVETVIEDYFTDKTLNMKFKGKTFKSGDLDEKDAVNHFGKAVLSMLVKKRCKKIDFSKFSEIFDKVDEIIKDYQTILSTKTSQE